MYCSKSYVKTVSLPLSQNIVVSSPVLWWGPSRDETTWGGIFHFHIVRWPLTEGNWKWKAKLWMRGTAVLESFVSVFSRSLEKFRETRVLFTRFICLTTLSLQMTEKNHLREWWFLKWNPGVCGIDYWGRRIYEKLRYLPLTFYDNIKNY